VHGLAGIAMTRSGQVMFFVAVADRVAVPETLEARADLDRIAAALTTCGC
jgi:D-alanyl-D-alanine carboxypeptidase/D-alanyl-D-alanine-endopeptidase (penicillin-binding protein 4)